MAKKPIPKHEGPNVGAFERPLILMMGDTGAGKSTVINALLNQSVAAARLQAPAKTSSASMGTTSKMQYYYSRAYVLIDTVGFFDRKYDQKHVENEFINFLLALSLGVNKVFFCLKAGKFKQHDVATFDLLGRLFGDEIYECTTLVITHVDDEDSPTLQWYLKENAEDEELVKFVTKFKHVILGSFQVHKKKELDDALEKVNRAPFLAQLLQDFERTSKKKYFMRKFNWKAFVQGVWNVFLPWLRSDSARLKHLFESDRLSVHECPICLEPVLNDLFITGCAHAFHYDCLATYMQVSNNTDCPLCRQEVKEFAHFKKAPEGKKEQKGKT